MGLLTDLLGDANGTYAPPTALHLPGVAGNYVSTPAANDLNITGDLELVVRVGLDDWTPGSVSTLISKWDASNQSFYLRIGTDGTPYLGISTTGANEIALIGNAACPFADGEVGWLKVTKPVASTTATFSWAPDSETEPTSWTPFASGSNGAAAAPLFAGTSTVNVGCRTSGSLHMTGKVVRAIIRNGIGGTTVADYRADAPMGSRYRDSTGKVWTINGSAWSWTLAGN